MAPKRKAAATAAHSDDKAKHAKHGIAVGEHLPALAALETEEAQTIDIAELSKEKGLVLLFYPRASLTGPTKQAEGFRDNYDKIMSSGYEVLGVSPDKPKTLANFKEKHKIQFHLLSDPKLEAMKTLGVAKGPKTIHQSHIIVEKGGKVGSVEIDVKPEESFTKALEFVTAHAMEVDGQGTSAGKEAVGAKEAEEGKEKEAAAAAAAEGAKEKEGAGKEEGEKGKEVEVEKAKEAAEGAATGEEAMAVEQAKVAATEEAMAQAPGEGEKAAAGEEVKAAAGGEVGAQGAAGEEGAAVAAGGAEAKAGEEGSKAATGGEAAADKEHQAAVQEEAAAVAAEEAAGDTEYKPSTEEVKAAEAAEKDAEKAVDAEQGAAAAEGTAVV